MAGKDDDPLAVWHQMLGNWETSVNKFANDAMGSEEFSGAMNKITSATSGAKQAFEQAMQRYLATMNLPSRQDLSAIGERLQAIEGQLYHLTQLVERLPAKDGVSEAAPPQAQKPARTRKPPEAG